jgi:hypothetical protein
MGKMGRSSSSGHLLIDLPLASTLFIYTSMYSDERKMLGRLRLEFLG